MNISQNSQQKIQLSTVNYFREKFYGSFLWVKKEARGKK